MADINIHGIEIVEGGKEIRAIRSPNQSVIGIVGTASAKSTLTADTPTSFIKKKAALEAVFPAGATGEKGTLYDALIGIFEQGDATVVVSRAKSSSEADVLSAIESLLDSESVTGLKPKIIIAPGFGSSNSGEVPPKQNVNPLPQNAPQNAAPGK